MVTLNITEHTERPEFIQSLQHQLGIQFRIFQELKLQTETVHKPQGDIFIFKSDSVRVSAEDQVSFDENSDALVAMIETKNLHEAILERHAEHLQSYLEQTKCHVGFITNYRDLKYYDFADDFSIQASEVFHSDHTDELTQFIAKKIEKKTDITIGYRAEEIVSFLENSIDELMVYTAKIPDDEWEKFVRLSDILERDAKVKEMSPDQIEEREKFFQRTAAYIAIAQILFYIVFRNFLIQKIQEEDREGNPSAFPRLRHLSLSNGIPSSIQEILEDVPNNDLDFRAIFGKNRDIFSHLEDEASNVLDKIIKKLEGISAKFVIEYDLIGQIFQRLMPLDTRKNLAAYYTLDKAAELLCELSIDDKNAIIYDPACGSGTLLAKAYKRKKALGLNQHKKLLEQIKGSDISDIAAMMSTITLAIMDPSKWTDEVQIYPHDAFALIHGLTKFFNSAQATADGKRKVSPIFAPDKDYRVDILLGNPPFTKGERLSLQTREVLKGLDMVQKYDIRCDFKRMNLYAFFLLIAPLLVKKDTGKIAFILPIGAINAEIMIQVWKVIFNENFGLKILIEASDTDESFSDSEDQEIMVILERNYSENARLVKLYGKLNEKDIGQLVQRINEIDTPNASNDDFMLQSIDQTELQSKPCMEWRTHPSNILLLLYSKFVPLDLSQLSEENQILYNTDLSDCIQVLTENASRPVDYWFLPNKYWAIDAIDDKNIIIRVNAVNRIISGNSHAKQILHLPLENFIPAMSRKLKDYRSFPPIIDNLKIMNYYLIDENNQEQDMKLYYKWGQNAHDEEYYGVSHSSFTPVKNEIGLLKKLDFTTAKTLAIKFTNKLMGSRIIIMGFSSTDPIYTDLFFAYLTSSLFLWDAMEKARSRRAEFVTINQIDFYLIFRFPNIKEIAMNEAKTNKILTASTAYNSTLPVLNRPVLPKLIHDVRVNRDHLLQKLDISWFEALDLPIQLLDSLYQEMEERLIEIVEKKKATTKKSSRRRRSEEDSEEEDEVE